MRYLKQFESFDDNKEVVDALKKILHCVKTSEKITSKINGGTLWDLHDKCEDDDVKSFLSKAAEITELEIQGSKTDLTKEFEEVMPLDDVEKKLDSLIQMLEANPEKDEDSNFKIESFTKFTNESLHNFHHISEEELNLFSQVPALEELITKMKVRLEKDGIHFDENDLETVEILKSQGIITE